MDKEQRRELEELIDDLKCPKDFRCYKSGLEELCQAEDIGQESFLVCRDEGGKRCKFSMDYGGGLFCKCPLRIHIAKELKK